MTDHRPNIGKLTKRGSIKTLFLTGILLIFSGCFTTKSVSQNATTFTVSNNTAVYDSVPDDSLTIALIKPYKATMEAQMSEYIATIDSPFSNAFFVGNLGRLAADYMLLSANAISIKEFGVPCHFAISNNGGFRTGFYPGPVTMQQLFEVMPFENELVLVQLPGIYVDSLFQYIATIDSPFSNAFFVGNLGRLAADYMLLSANAISIKEFGVPCHFAISNNGGFRTGFYPGPVTMQQLFEVMPFENELVLVQLSGIFVDSLFQYIAQLQGTPASGFLMSYSKGNTRKDNRYQSLKLNAQPVNSIQDLLNPQYTQPLDTRRDYLIAVNSYMVVGGDGFTMLKHAKKIHYTGINLRTVLAQQLKAEYEANKFIDPRKQIRIYHEPQ